MPGLSLSLSSLSLSLSLTLSLCVCVCVCVFCANFTPTTGSRLQLWCMSSSRTTSTLRDNGRLIGSCGDCSLTVRSLWCVHACIRAAKKFMRCRNPSSLFLLLALCSLGNTSVCVCVCVCVCVRARTRVRSQVYYQFWYIGLYVRGWGRRKFAAHVRPTTAQTVHNVWYSFLGVVQWTAIECAFLHCYATGRLS